MKKISVFFKGVKKWANTHKTLFSLIVTLLFIASQIPFLINHEIWNDEATSWQLSKEINLGNFYEVNSAEPHPMLWQLVLAPFSKLGFPIITLNIISLLFVAAAVFLVTRYAKMSFFTKFIFFVSAAFFYFLPIISRDYSMIPLALVLVCLAYEKRHEKPLLYGLALTFLSQTHFLMYGLLFMFILGYIIEVVSEKDGKVLKTLAIFLLPLIISGLTSLPIVINSMNNQAILTEKVFENTPEEARDPFFENLIWSFFGSDNMGLEILFIVLLSFTAITFFIKNQKTFIYLAGGVFFWFFVMCNVYKNYEVFAPKVALILLIIFAVIWLNVIEDTKKPNKVEKVLMNSEIIKFLNTKVTRDWHIVFAVILALATTPNTFSFAIDDFHYPFSNSKEIASYINEKIESGSVIVEGEPTMITSAVDAYIENDVTIYSVFLGREKTRLDNLKYDNATLDNKREKYDEGIKVEDLGKILDELSEKYEHVYYIGISPSCNSSYLSETRTAIDNTFEKLENFNTEEYLDTGHYRAIMYKIK